MRFSSAHSEAIQDAFGPDNWEERAARGLHVSQRFIRFVRAGQRKLSRRHLRMLEHIAQNRTGNAHKDLARRQAALAREVAEWLKRAKASDLKVRHLLEEEKRQGRTKRGRHNL